jgi:hypothetical protein
MAWLKCLKCKRFQITLFVGRDDQLVYFMMLSFIKHLHQEHGLSIELGKFKRPSTWWKGLRHQDHPLMNAHEILSNPLSRLWHNERNLAITRTKTFATCECDHLWNDALQIKLAPKPTLVRVVSSKLFILLSIPTWGVGSTPPCNNPN